MAEILYYAIPFFVLLLVVEALSFRHARDDADDLIGYEANDTRTSLLLGTGNVIINVAWKLVVLAIFVAVYELSPLRLDPGDWWVWVLLFFADDFSYYWFHRISHESRFFWASHVVHHSSTHYNLSTALRQTWVPMTYFPFWLWMPAVGFEPWMVLLAQSWSLIYQFWIHTERVRKLPRFLEVFLNTPSHHRVHHGSNQVYLDRNYGGILIIWDRLFGTWSPEGERVRYGLTKNIDTFNPVRAAFHEYIAMWHDVRRAPPARPARRALPRPRLGAAGDRERGQPGLGAASQLVGVALMPPRPVPAPPAHEPLPRLLRPAAPAAAGEHARQPRPGNRSRPAGGIGCSCGAARPAPRFSPKGDGGARRPTLVGAYRPPAASSASRARGSTMLLKEHQPRDAPARWSISSTSVARRRGVHVVATTA